MQTRVRHLKKGDNVVCLSGSKAGKSAKIVEVSHKRGMVKVDGSGIGVTQRHTKPSQTNPKGGIVEQQRWLPASKFMVADASGKALGRVAFETTGDEKKRVFSLARKKK